MWVISWKVAALVVGQVVLVPGFLRCEEQVVTLRQAPDVPLFEFTRSMPVSREGLAVYEGLVVCLMFHVTTVMHAPLFLVRRLVHTPATMMTSGNAYRRMRQMRIRLPRAKRK